MRKILTLSLPPQLLAKVERLAKRDNRNKSEVLREAVWRYIEEREWRDVLKYAKKIYPTRDIYGSRYRTNR